MNETKFVTRLSMQRQLKEVLKQAVQLVLVLLCVAILTGCAEMANEFAKGMAGAAVGPQTNPSPSSYPGTASTSPPAYTPPAPGGYTQPPSSLPAPGGYTQPPSSLPAFTRLAPAASPVTFSVPNNWTQSNGGALFDLGVSDPTAEITVYFRFMDAHNANTEVTKIGDWLKTIAFNIAQTRNEQFQLNGMPAVYMEFTAQANKPNTVDHGKNMAMGVTIADAPMGKQVYILGLGLSDKISPQLLAKVDGIIKSVTAKPGGNAQPGGYTQSSGYTQPGGNAQSGLTPRAGLPFSMGAWVLSRYKGGSYYYPGVVAGINGNNITTKHDDGNVDIRPSREVKPYNWLPGTRLECNWRGAGTWYPGTISGMQGNAGLSIHYDDGDRENTTTARCRSL